MPPPPLKYVRRDPLAEARARFMEEPPPARFFPPVGQGGTSFSGYVSPAAAERFALEDEARDVQKDQRATEMESNAYRRLESRSRSRLLPYTEAAGIAAAKTRKAQEESQERLNPFAETASRERAQTEAEQYAAERRALPGTEALGVAERQAKMDELETRDEYRENLTGLTKNPRHQLAYQSFLRRTKPNLPVTERQRQAFNESLRFAQDEEAVNAIEEADEDGTIRDKFVEDVVDDDGVYLGPRLKKDVNRSEVAKFMATRRNQKVRLAQEREDRIASSAANAIHLKVLDSRRDSIIAQLRDTPKDPELSKKLSDVDAELDALRGGMKAATPSTKAQAPDPEAKPTLSRWLGK